MESLTHEQWADIDELIRAGSIIPAMARIRKACAVSLPDARDLFRSRYRQLRAEPGAEFARDDEEDLFEAIAKGWRWHAAPAADLGSLPECFGHIDSDPEPLAWPARFLDHEPRLAISSTIALQSIGS